MSQIVVIENPMLCVSAELEEDSLLKQYNLGYGKACLAQDDQMPLFDDLWAMDNKEL